MKKTKQNIKNTHYRRGLLAEPFEGPSTELLGLVSASGGSFLFSVNLKRIFTKFIQFF